MLEDLVKYSLWFLILVYFAYAFSTRKKRRIAKEKRKRRKKLRRMAKLCWRDFRVSNALKAYKENTLVADSDYLRKIILVKGKIRTIDKEYPYDSAIFKEPVIFLSNSRFSVWCWMQESEEELLMEMQVGDEINVYGVINNRINQDIPVIRLVDCLIQTMEE